MRDADTELGAGKKQHFPGRGDIIPGDFGKTHGHALLCHLHGAEHARARQNTVQRRTDEFSGGVHNADIGDGRLAHGSVLVKGNGTVHAAFRSFPGHKHVGQVIGILDCGQILLFGRHLAGKGGHAFLIEFLAGLRLSDGHDVQARLRALKG